MFCMETTKCSCGCDKRKCDFNPCAVTCGKCVENFGDYAYIYNITEQTVEECAPVTFSSNGPLSCSITHTAGTAETVIGKTGVYLVNFYADSSGKRAQTKLTLYRNGEPVKGSTYSTGGGITYGQLMFAAQMGDVVTLVNTGNDEVKLSAEGTTPEAVVNASMTFIRLF